MLRPVFYALLQLAPLTGFAQPAPPDTAAIRETVLEYAHGWYTGDGDRMGRVLHPALVRRIVRQIDGLARMDELDAEGLTGVTREGFGTRTPVEARRADVSILDVRGNAAAVRLEMRDWVDYMHLTWWNGKWKIVNVLWTLRHE